MDALAVDDTCTVDRDRCIGCGLCISSCPTDALHMVERDDVTIPPKNTQALYRKILTERFGTWGTAKIMARAMLGLKI
jgi:ferredoxin